MDQYWRSYNNPHVKLLSCSRSNLKMGSHSKQVAFDERYVKSLILDKSKIQYADYAAGRELLLSYSHISEEKIPSHVAEIQRRAYDLCPYPCIGLLRFLICSLSEQEAYPEILDRLGNGASYLDIGCCFAQDIRRLSFDGAPTEKCVGVDIEPGFIGLSEELFSDKGRLPARMATADIFEESNPFWTSLHGTFDVVHASSFFHLFGLPKQRQIAHAIARLIRPGPGSIVLGLQLAAAGEAEVIPIINEDEPTYCHSLATMQELWANAGRAAGLEAQGLTWDVKIIDRAIPQAMRIGLLANPKLKEITWVARTMPM